MREYWIAIRNDGAIFRVHKNSILPDRFFCIQRGDQPCAFRNRYFDFKGDLRDKYKSLPIL